MAWMGPERRARLLEDVVKRHAVILAVLAATLAAPPISAGGLEDVDIYFGSRLRYENLNNYTDLSDHSGTEGNDRVSFTNMRTRLGLMATVADGVGFDVELQNISTFGNTDPFRSEVDPLLQNQPTSASGFGEEPGDTTIYRAVVSLRRIGGTAFQVDAGRQELVLGSGLILGNEDFYGGTTLDGARGWYNGGAWQAGGFWFNTGERSDSGSQFFQGSPVGSDDMTLYGGYGRFTFKGERNRQTVDVYAIRRDDHARNSGHANDLTAGVAWLKPVDSVEEAQESPMAWQAELAWQMGEIEDLLGTGETIDLSGWVFEGRFGWNFVSGRTLHEPFAGAFLIPGEDDFSGTDLTLFMPLYPEAHGRLGEADFITVDLASFGFGITAFRAGYRIRSGRHEGSFTYWAMDPSEDEITLGSTSVELDSFGTEIDLIYDFAYRDQVHLFVSASQFDPDDSLSDIFFGGANEGDPVTRIYGGLRLMTN